jgi:hypothetical protein
VDTFIVVPKEHILAELRRTAEENGGKPLGRDRFSEHTGIRPGEWGRYWARWGDAVSDAGLTPNELQSRYEDDEVLARLAREVRRLGRMPTVQEMRLLRRQDKTFPSAGVYAKFGPKQRLAAKVAAYCRERTGYGDVLELLTPLPDAGDQPPGAHTDEPTEFGYVYLLKSGRYYKLGRTNSLGRRQYELGIQLPERAELLHQIKTDDPVGIEASRCDGGRLAASSSARLRFAGRRAVRAAGRGRG